jgi:aspartyl-tRNA(Asn)/glutamyl-tRNA(Gln) amidotransferase subunit A
MADEFASMSAGELLAGYRLRRFSPVDVVLQLSERIGRLQPELNAFYLLDKSGSLAAARESERRWYRGAPIGLLDGVPSSAKDALALTGTPVYRGSAASEPKTSDSDAPVIARMREAGAIFLGKTTMPDFGILASGLSSQHGVTRNPRNVAYTPGGSSAGTAAAIAAGLHPLAVGTDIVGSIRLPASFTGIFGFKPSQGRVPYYFPNSPALVAGPMARTVADAAVLMSVIAAPDARDFTSLPPASCPYHERLEVDLSGARVGILADLGFGLEADAEVLATVTSSAALLQRAGLRLSTMATRFEPNELRTAERFYQARCRAELNSCPAERRSAASIIEAWSAPAEAMNAVQLYGVFNELQRLREKAYRLIEAVDFIVLPTVARPAFRAELPGFTSAQLFEPWSNAFLFNLTEQPASSVPCGVTSSGLPIGLQIVGRRFDDLGVLQLSRLCERLFAATPPAEIDPIQRK